MTTIIDTILFNLASWAPTICNSLPYLHLIFVTNSLYTNAAFSNGPFYILLFVWSISEVVFYVYMTILIYHLNSKPVTKKINTTPEVAKILIESILKQSKGQLLELMYNWKSLCEPNRFIRGDITLKNAKNWICWVVYHVRSYDELTELEKKVIDENFLQNEDFKNLNLKEDYDEKSAEDWKFYDFNTLEISRIPLMLYVLIWLLRLVIDIWFLSNGFGYFKVKKVNSIGYWLRRGSSSDPPIIFVHGLGIGLLQYLTKIYQLTKLHPERTLVIIQLDYVSLSLVSKIPSTKDHLIVIDHIFKSENLKKASWVTHSYGSFIGAFLSQKRPQYIQNITFIDPICFGLIFCNSLFNLLFKLSDCWTLSFIRYFGAKELSFNLVLHREFNWQDRIFWPQYCDLIEGKITVYLSELDSIINHKEIEEYIIKNFTYNNFELKAIPKTFHGGYLFDLPKLKNILRDL